MDAQYWLIIGVAVFVGLVFLYIIFKLCGGRFIDVLSCYRCCGCFEGPCCDLWGLGGRIRPRDRDYPFRGSSYYDGFFDPYHASRRPQANLPPIVIVNSGDNKNDSRRGRRGDSDGDSDRTRSDSDSEDEDEQKRRKKRRVRSDQLERVRRVNDRDEFNVVV